MKSLACAALAGPLLLALAGAARAQDKMETTPYYPLAVGSTWEYRVGDNKFTLKVTKHEKVGNVLCARVEYLVKDKDKGAEKVQSFEHISVSKDGVTRNSQEGKEITPPVLFLKLPPKKDETWKVDSKTAGGETVKGAFKNNGEEEVKVPAGSYKAVVVASQNLEANGVKMSVTYYFAEKVGIVKQLIEVAGQKVVVELEKYEAGKG